MTIRSPIRDLFKKMSMSLMPLGHKENVLKFFINRFNIRPLAAIKTSFFLEKTNSGLVCALCNGKFARQQFYVSGDLPSWKSVGRGTFIVGSVSTACPSYENAFLNNDAEFSNASSIFYFNFTSRNVPSINDVTQSQWTIRQ